MVKLKSLRLLVTYCLSFATVFVSLAQAAGWPASPASWPAIPASWPQQPQAQSGQPIYAVNAKYVQGVGPGYWPTAGAGLTLNLSAGTAFCNLAVVTYAGGTLTMTASATNNVYLDPTATCAPASNTTGLLAGHVPIAQVVTSASAIITITDLRTWFFPQSCKVSATGGVNCSALGTNQSVTLTPTGTAAATARNFATSVNVVTFSATPTFDVSLGNVQEITLTGNVTSSTLSNATAGQELMFVICQDATGTRTFAWPASFRGTMTVGALASKCSAQSFIWDGTTAFALSPGVTNM